MRPSAQARPAGVGRGAQNSGIAGYPGLGSGSRRCVWAQPQHRGPEESRGLP